MRRFSTRTAASQATSRSRSKRSGELPVVLEGEDVVGAQPGSRHRFESHDRAGSEETSQPTGTGDGYIKAKNRPRTSVSLWKRSWRFRGADGSIWARSSVLVPAVRWHRLDPERPGPALLSGATIAEVNMSRTPTHRATLWA
jgi:hypothetical protein